MKAFANIKSRYAEYKALDSADKVKAWKEGLINNAIYLLIIIAVIYTYTQNSRFLSVASIVNIISLSAANIPIACGIAGTIVLTGTDLSAGRVVGLTACISASLLQSVTYATKIFPDLPVLPIPLVILIVIVVGGIVGWVNGFFVAKFHLHPFIVTLAGMFFGRGMTAIISTDMISIKNELFLKWANFRFYMPFGSTNKKGKFIPAYIPPTVVIAVIVVIIIAVLLKYRKFGRKLYAIGGNRQSALMMGLNVKRTMFQAYVLDGFLAGLGGFLFCLNSCAGFVEQAKGLEMDAISSAVIGGTLLSGGVGTPIGTLFGVLIKGTISSLITTQGTLSSWWVRIILSLLLCFFIVIQSVIASMKKKAK